MENAEINNIIKILGLQYKKNYSDPESLKTLRYGKIMIMTDQVCQQLNLKNVSYTVLKEQQKIVKLDLKSFLVLIVRYLLNEPVSTVVLQDQDGSHIKGLLINFIHHNWPALLKHNFLEEFITPIIKVLAPTGQLKAEDTVTRLY